MKGSMKIQGVAKNLVRVRSPVIYHVCHTFLRNKVRHCSKIFRAFFPPEYIVLSVPLFFFYKYVSVDRGCCVHTSKINMFMIKMYIYSF